MERRTGKKKALGVRVAPTKAGLNRSPLRDCEAEVGAIHHKDTSNLSHGQGGCLPAATGRVLRPNWATSRIS